ncbi:phytoene desaturase family protein [Gordonia aichiensis]|uniref:phytoene desaturase family protein n=1 Tax=Gordonia aichiensis TaxID=36820 RepID=UPI000349AC4C|nr:NAD(P)/FAD-dependent oxidoreductase [Gordonia aichiensis]
MNKPFRTGHRARHDAIVVGAGHNGLIAAAYLARGGRSVLVVERDVVPGGAVSTVERFPGYRVDSGSSAHLMIRHSPIIDELDLGSHGLRYIDCDPWGFAPATEDGPPLVFRTDLDSTCASIAAACSNTDADAYRRFVGEWGPRSRAVLDAFNSPATLPRFGRAFAGIGTTAHTARRGLFGRRAGSLMAATQELMMSGDALLDRWFDSERLKAALAWFGAQSGPPMNAPGTAPMVGFAALMHRIPPGRAVGGSGALTESLLNRLDADGAQVLTGAPATSISRCSDHWRVQTVDGAHCADQVVGACHVLATLDMLEAGGSVPASQIHRWRREIDIGSGIGMAVRLGTRELPAYRDLPSDLPPHGVHSALGLLATDRAQLRRAYAAASVGELPPHPPCVVMSFSAIDPTLAPAQRHSITVWSQWHPRRLRDGEWSTAAGPAADAILGEVDRHAPGLSTSIEHRLVQSPADLESELGLVGGNIMHVEMTIDQMFTYRPHPDLAGHRVPGADGLFLAGASTHPGGGVTGASGRIAAQLALRAGRRPRSR